MHRLFIAIAAILAPAAAQAEPALEMQAKGVQIYACSDGAWRLRAPEASLIDPSGRIVVHHFAGPTWQATDGSTVTGAAVTSSASPDAGAVPWLILRAAGHDGAGVLERVAYITRTRTSGGAAPEKACTAGAEISVPYTATYTFFSSP